MKHAAKKHHKESKHHKEERLEEKVHPGIHKKIKKMEHKPKKHDGKMEKSNA